LKLRKYQNEATVTDIRANSIKMICNGFGLIGELEELEREVQRFHGEDIIKELGDVLWYCASICTYLSLDLQDIYESNFETELSMPLAEIFKKVYRDKKGVFDETDKKYIKAYIRDAICGISEDDMDNITNMNIAKLNSRQQRGVIGGNGSNR